MTHRALPIALLVLAAFSASAFAADGTFDRSITFSGAATVSVSTGSGYIHITPGPDNHLHVVGHVHTPSGWLSAGNPDAAVRQIVANPPVTQTGSIITIGRTKDNPLYNHVAIDYDISTPRSTLLVSRAGSGGIEISGISGAVTAESGSGSLHLALADSSDVKARTGSGSIHIEGAQGTLHADTGSGSIEATGNIGSIWNLSTGSGSIRIKLPGNTRFTLDASTGSGSVQVDQPITMHGSMNHHHISGNVNGGGPTLHASTGSGSIDITSSTSH